MARPILLASTVTLSCFALFASATSSSAAPGKAAAVAEKSAAVSGLLPQLKIKVKGHTLSVKKPGRKYLSFHVPGKVPGTVLRVGQISGSANVADSLYMIATEPRGGGHFVTVHRRQYPTKGAAPATVTNAKAASKVPKATSKVSKAMAAAKATKPSDVLGGADAGIYTFPTANDRVLAVFVVHPMGRFAGASARLSDGSVAVRLQPVEGATITVAEALVLAASSGNEMVYNLPATNASSDQPTIVWDYERVDAGTTTGIQAGVRPRHHGVMMGMGQKDAYVSDNSQAQRPLNSLMASPSFGIVFVTGKAE